MQDPRSSTLRSQVAIAGAAEQGGLRTDGAWGWGVSTGATCMLYS